MSNMVLTGRIPRYLLTGVVATFGLYCGVCPKEVFRQHLDKNRITYLQQIVNDGHEPWRLDSADVARAALTDFLGRKSDGEQLEGHGPLEVQSEGASTAVFQTRALNGGITYRVTLKRFSWLLPTAKKWQWMVWTPVEIAIERCRPTASK